MNSPSRELDALVHKHIFGLHCGLLPAYSTDIAAAWRVLERLKETGWDVAVRDTRNAATGAAATLFDDNGEAGPETVFGSTVPHAICLVALASVGVSFSALD